MTDVEAPLEVGSGIAGDESAFSAGQGAARAALSSIRRHALSVVLVYAADHYELAQVLNGVRAVVGDAPVYGATTTGEIHGGVHRRSVVVVAIASPHLSVHGAVGGAVSAGWRAALDQALEMPTLASLLDERSELSQQLMHEGRNLFALLFYPGSASQGRSDGREILAHFNARSGGRIPVFGGASAGDLHSEVNRVIHAGEPRADALLLLVFETRLEFGIALGHGFRPTRRLMTATEVDGDEIVTLDGVAAADVLARSLGTTRAELAARHVSLSSRHVLGTPHGPEQFSVSVASYLTARGGVRVTPKAAAGAELTVLEPIRDAMVHAAADATRTAMLRGGIARPALVLLHYGALRPRFVGEDDVRQELDGVLRLAGSAPLAGFLSYGEIGPSDDGVSRDSNASVAALVLGDRLSAPARVALENVADLSELKQAQRSLQRSEESLHAITDSSPALISYLDRQLRFRFANQTYRDWFGVDPERLVGRNLREVYGAGVDAAMRPYIDAALGGERVSHQREMVTRDDRRRFIEMSIVPHYDGASEVDGFFMQIQDLTPRRHVEEALRRSEQQLKLALECGGIGTWDWNVVTGDQYWSEHTYALLGAPAGETANLDILLHQVHPDDRAELERQTGAVVAGDIELDSEFRVVHPSGEVRWLAARARGQYDGDGRCLRVVGVLRDATAQRQHRQAMVEAENARRTSAAKSDFLARLSHELRSPLNVVLGFTQLLTDGGGGPLAADQRQRLEYIEQAGRQLVEIADGMLNLSALERGETVPALEPVAVGPLLDEAVAQVQGEAAGAGISIRRDEAEAERLAVVADRSRLRQCVVNLLSSSVKLSRNGGTLTISTRPLGATVALSVADGAHDGATPPATVDPDPTAGGRPGAKPRLGGAGIKLTIARRLVESMHGQLIIDSAPGAGSRSTLRLPRARNDTGADAR